MSNSFGFWGLFRRYSFHLAHNPNRSEILLTHVDALSFTCLVGDSYFYSLPKLISASFGSKRLRKKSKKTLKLTRVGIGLYTIGDYFEPFLPAYLLKTSYQNIFKIRDKLVGFVVRKSKSFNKGRYSRNRQTYRTGVYWCLYFNLVFVLPTYYYCYKFSFNFGYLWYIGFFFLNLFVLNKATNITLSYNVSIFKKSLFLLHRSIVLTLLGVSTFLSKYLFSTFFYLTN